MAATIPTDIARNIYTQALSVRNSDNRAEIVNTIWGILDFVPTSRVLYTSVPIFEGASTDLYVESFVVDKTGQPNGLVMTSMTFWILDAEFVVEYNEYRDGKPDVSLYIVNKSSKYGDLAAEAFFRYFDNGIVF